MPTNFHQKIIFLTIRGDLWPFVFLFRIVLFPLFPGWLILGYDRIDDVVEVSDVDHAVSVNIADD